MLKIDGKFVAWIGFISSILGIIAFLGYSSYKSFYETEKSQKNDSITLHTVIEPPPVIKPNLEIDDNLVGVWLITSVADDKGFYLKRQYEYTFNKNLTGKLTFKDSSVSGPHKYLFGEDDGGSYESVVSCPFAYKIKIDSDGDKTAVIKFGIGELIKSKINGAVLYSDNIGKQWAESYSNFKKEYNYYVQGDILYWGDGVYVLGKGTVRDKYSRQVVNLSF